MFCMCFGEMRVIEVQDAKSNRERAFRHSFTRIPYLIIDSSNEIRDTKSSYTLGYAELGSNQQQALRHSLTRIPYLIIDTSNEIRDTKRSYSSEYAEFGSTQKQALRHSFTRIPHLFPTTKKPSEYPAY